MIDSRFKLTSHVKLIHASRDQRRMLTSSLIFVHDVIFHDVIEELSPFQIEAVKVYVVKSSWFKWPVFVGDVRLFYDWAVTRWPQNGFLVEFVKMSDFETTKVQNRSWLFTWTKIQSFKFSNNFEIPNGEKFSNGGVTFQLLENWWGI